MKLLVPMEDFSHAPSKLTSSPEGLPPPPALYHPPFLTALLLWALFCSSGVSTNTFSLLPHSSYLFFFFHSGGAQYDQNHIILNTVNTEKLTQVWEAMVL